MDFAALLAEHTGSKDKKTKKRDRDDDDKKKKKKQPNNKDKRRKKDWVPERGRFEGCWSEERLAKVKGKYLIIICAGDNSLHDDVETPWHGQDTGYDLCIVYFGSNEEKREQYRAQAKILLEKKGPKWQLVRHALKSCDWQEYEYIWLPDDDLKMEQKLIKKMFEIASDNELLLSQPALFDKNIQRQYRHILLKRDGLLLHYTNFVEIMCPLFRVDALVHVFPTMDSDECKSGWGLDMLWPTMLKFNKIGVIDATPLLHTRPQNAFNVGNSFYQMYAIDPQREYHDLMMKYRFRDFKKTSFEEVVLKEQTPMT